MCIRDSLSLAPPHAERLYVGKKKSAHAFSQEEICGLLIERARRGLTVVRLKGGDPFIFGRGGEEAEALADAGIPFEIVPGVTTPLGIAAYTGVPLTHREHTSAVTFVTGHAVEAIDWAKVGHAETLVIFMGLTTFPEIARQLMAHGRSPDTPTMAVRSATRRLRAARPRYCPTGHLRLARLHQRQRRALLPGPPRCGGERSAQAARQDLRHRPGHARRRRGAAPQGGPDGQGVRRRRNAGSLRRS